MQRGFFGIFLLVLLGLLIATAVGGYYIISKNSPIDPNTKAKDKQSLTFDNDKIVPPLPPKDQETNYTNDKLGIKFTVPAGFEVAEETEKDFHKRSNGDIRKNFADYMQHPPPKFVASFYVLDSKKDFEKSPFVVWVFENPDNLDPSGFYDKYWYYPFIWGQFASKEKGRYAPTDSVTLTGTEALTVKGLGKTIDFQPGSPKFIYAEYKDRMYLLKVINENQGDKILKSFIFPNWL